MNNHNQVAPMGFALNRQAADKATAGGNSITSSGVYTGIFWQAKHITAKTTGSQGVELMFKTRDGKEARFINLYYMDREGNILDVGYNNIQAIMVILGANDFNPVKGQYIRFKGKEKIQEQGYIFPSIMKQELQVAFQIHRTMNPDGSHNDNVEFRDVFRLDGFSAREINAGSTQPLDISNTQDWLADNPFKVVQASQNGRMEYQQGQGAGNYQQQPSPYQNTPNMYDYGQQQTHQQGGYSGPGPDDIPGFDDDPGF